MNYDENIVRDPVKLARYEYMLKGGAVDLRCRPGFSKLMVGFYIPVHKDYLVSFRVMDLLQKLAQGVRIKVRRQRTAKFVNLRFLVRGVKLRILFLLFVSYLRMKEVAGTVRSIRGVAGYNAASLMFSFGDLTYFPRLLGFQADYYNWRHRMRVVLIASGGRDMLLQLVAERFFRVKWKVRDLEVITSLLGTESDLYKDN